MQSTKQLDNTNVFLFIDILFCKVACLTPAKLLFIDTSCNAYI